MEDIDSKGSEEDSSVDESELNDDFEGELKRDRSSDKSKPSAKGGDKKEIKIQQTNSDSPKADDSGSTSRGMSRKNLSSDASLEVSKTSKSHTTGKGNKKGNAMTVQQETLMDNI